MVSVKNLVQAILVVAGAAAASAQAQAQGYRVLDRVPLMPRIPSHAKHHEVLQARSETAIDHDVLVKVECLSRDDQITLHDETVAQLSICGGMPGSIDSCRGSPSTTVGEAGTALFTVAADRAGASITMTKHLWMRCVQAARHQCPTGSLSATCAGGASSGDVSFTLERPRSRDL